MGTGFQEVKGRINDDTVALIMKWMEHGGEESHPAILDFLNNEKEQKKTNKA